MKVKIKINIYDILMFLTIILFFFSENTTGVLFLDSLFGILERYKVKFVFSLFVVLICLLKIKKIKWFLYEFKFFLINIVILTVISLVAVVFNGNKSDIINEVLYFLVPLIFSFCMINVKEGNVYKCIDLFYGIVIFGFLLIYREKFTIKSFLSINFINSYSPFEGEIAFLAILLVIYYRWIGNKKRTIISLIICILSFKRITILLAIAFMLYMNNIKRGKVSIRKKFFAITILILVPVFMNAICSDSFSNYFYLKTGMNFDLFVKGRFSAMNVAFDKYRMGGGLGSVRLFLSEYFRGYYNTQVRTYDLHCDMVRFYLECTILGSFSLLFMYYKCARTNICFFFITYIFIESCVNHMFGGGRTLFWIIAYMMIYLFNKSENR